MTKLEQQRIERMMRLGCVACAYLDIVNSACDCHHILHGNIQMGEWYTLPLCPGHHRGVWVDEQIQLIPRLQRVALSDGRKAFTEVYPPERDLWVTVQRRLHLSQEWPASKIVPLRLV